MIVQNVTKLGKFRKAFRENTIKIVGEKGKEGLISVQTAFDFGFEAAKRTESLQRTQRDKKFDALEGTNRAQINYQAMSLLAEVGMTQKDIDLMNIDPSKSLSESLFNMEKLSIEGVQARLKDTHNRLLADSLNYPLLCQMLMTYLQYTLYCLGWNKYRDIEDEELIARLTVQRELYCNSNVVEEQNKSVLADLLCNV